MLIYFLYHEQRILDSSVASLSTNNDKLSLFPFFLEKTIMKSGLNWKIVQVNSNLSQLILARSQFILNGIFINGEPCACHVFNFRQLLMKINDPYSHRCTVCQCQVLSYNSRLKGVLGWTFPINSIEASETFQ